MAEISIDVVIITKNSDHLLRRCLNSICRNVPVNKLIVVDGHSEDNTLKIIQEFDKEYGNITLLFDDGNRATARQKGIQEVGAEWFAFIDSDVVLCNGWFHKARQSMKSNVGAIWGVSIDVIKNLRLSLFYRMLVKVLKEWFKLRGGLHDTLIRREAVKGIKIPPALHHYEDRYIIDHIKRRGYDVITPEDLFCLHYRSTSDWNISNSFDIAMMEIKNGLLDCHAFHCIKYYPFWILFWLLQRISLIGGTYHPPNNRQET